MFMTDGSGGKKWTSLPKMDCSRSSVLAKKLLAGPDHERVLTSDPAVYVAPSKLEMRVLCNRFFLNRSTDAAVM